MNVQSNTIVFLSCGCTSVSAAEIVYLSPWLRGEILASQGARRKSAPVTHHAVGLHFVQAVTVDWNPFKFAEAGMIPWWSILSWCVTPTVAKLYIATLDVESMLRM